MQDFIHLHVHSQYSLLDGQASIQALVDKAINNNMKGIALTDHGNMFGIKEFFNYVKKKNYDKNSEIKKIKKQIASIQSQEIVTDENKSELENCIDTLKKLEENLFKPILGCEMYVARKRLNDKNGKEDQSGYHLIVLAKNETGYHNLIKLVSKSWTEGFYYRPRTDREELLKYHEGLIISTACLAGEVPRKIYAEKIEEAEEAILWYKNLFGEDFYLELQRHKATVARANYEAYPMQQKVNEQLIKLAQKHQVKLICTNDVHFVNEENAEAHDHLICLSTGKDLDDPNRMLYSKQEWMKTKEEMNAIFSDVPDALSNTLEVLDKVEFYSIDNDPILPNFPKPEGFHDDNEYLRYLTYKGAEKRWGEMNDEQKERVDFELETIKNMGFPGYFLIVQDFIAAARNMNVSVGPGRGSAAGSAVAYCLGITQIDPIKFDLLFERFLNPDRISLPDIDIDFDDDGRGDVLHWVTEKYGTEKVAHIITYGTMATKMAIKDVARVEKLSLAESDRLTKLIPDRLPEIDGKAQKINLKNCIKNVQELQEACTNSDDKIRNTMKYAQMLEGNVRNTGVHACGTIICRDDITDWVPVSTADDKLTGEKMLVTQYEGSVIEETGLIKMDFLGLKTLSIIKEAIENIKQRHSITLDIENIDFNDPATYKLYCEGRTIGTFQFESAGMQKYLKELQPSTFEDLIAMNALYRPGPMTYIPQFINRKHGIEKIEYDIPIMEKYLKDTYGITVYQEQVMLLSRLLANFTRGESDSLRKAMGKKLRDKLDHMKPQFIEGGKKNGYDPKV
ncbi:MAG: DNA polymerase III subunit alpha, partial [Bacteroidales bacterium]|nr:DNA polymerase III subunit alpha [Bacteroidales bacterium]